MTVATLRKTILFVALLVLLFMVSVGLNPLSHATLTQGTGAGDSSRQIVYIIVFVIAAFAARIWQFRGAMTLPISMVLLLVWCWLSVFWAIDPDIAVRRLTLSTMMIFSAFLFANSLGYRATVSALRWFLAALLIANFVAVALSPEAVHNVREADAEIFGAWRGLLAHKNFTGPACAITTLLFVFDTGRMNKLIRFFMIAASVAFLYKTQSVTSLGLLVIAICIGAAFQVYNPRFKSLFIPAAVVAVVVLTVLFEINRANLVSAYYDPQAFTGRTIIWRALVAYSFDNPVFGAGYGSFWNIGDYSPIYQYGSGWVRTLYAGHSGYLDLLVTIGVPGTLLAIYALIIGPVIRILGSDGIKPASGGLLLAIIIFCAGHNATETSLMDRDAIVNVFLLLSAALIGVLLRDARRAAAPKP